MRPPKDLDKYLDSNLAGMRLMYLALQRVMGLKPGWKVKWSISISYWNDNPPEDMKVIPRQGSFSSGDAE